MPDFIAFSCFTYPKTPIFTAMKHLWYAFFLVIITLSAPACSKKSGCPADSAQTKVNKNGEYKAGKATSGLLPPKKNYKKQKGPYKPKIKEKHSN